MNIECSTCMEPLMANGDNSTTLCGHVFHTDCINRWFQKGKLNCPQCRNATTVHGLIKTHFSQAEEEIDRNPTGDALEADLKCIELAEKNESLQKEMKAMTTAFQEVFYEKKKLVEENEGIRNEKLELEKKYVKLREDNKNNMKRVQKLDKEKKELKLDVIRAENMSREILDLEEENEANKNEILEFEKKYGKLNEENISNLKSVQKLKEKIELLRNLDGDENHFLQQWVFQNNPKEENGFTLLHFAAKDGYKDICKMILDKQVGEDKNPKSKTGFTPLHYAALNGHVEIYKMIIEVAKDKNPKDVNGNTPLKLAAQFGQIRKSDMDEIEKIYMQYEPRRDDSCCIM